MYVLCVWGHFLRGPSCRVTAGTFHPHWVFQRKVSWPGHFREGLRRRREGLRRLVFTDVVLGKLRKAVTPVTLTYPPSSTQEDPVFCGKKSWLCMWEITDMWMSRVWTLPGWGGYSTNCSDGPCYWSVFKMIDIIKIGSCASFFNKTHL